MLASSLFIVNVPGIGAINRVELMNFIVAVWRSATTHRIWHSGQLTTQTQQILEASPSPLTAFPTAYSLS